MLLCGGNTAGGEEEQHVFDVKKGMSWTGLIYFLAVAMIVQLVLLLVVTVFYHLMICVPKEYINVEKTVIFVCLCQ